MDSKTITPPPPLKKWQEIVYVPNRWLGVKSTDVISKKYKQVFIYESPMLLSELSPRARGNILQTNMHVQRNF